MSHDNVGGFHYDKPISRYFISNHEFDVGGRRISNLLFPENANDAVSRQYLHTFCLYREEQMDKYDAKKRRITNLGEPLDDSDAVSFGLVKSLIAEKVREETDRNQRRRDEGVITLLKGSPPALVKHDEHEKSDNTGNTPTGAAELPETPLQSQGNV